MKSGKLFCYYFFIIGGPLLVLFLLMLRFALPAWIDRHPQNLANTLTQQFGLPVTIDQIDTEWNGWNPRLMLRNFRIRAIDNTDAELHFPEVTMLFDWRSLFRKTVLLRALNIEAPVLTVRRDKNGDVFFGGIPLGNSSNADTSDIPPLVGWLRRQNVIAINRGVLVWHDEQKNAPPFAVRDLTLHGRRAHNYYQIGVRGISDTDVPLDIRARIARQEESTSSAEWYVRFEHLDFPHLTQWFDLPVAIERGIGSMQAWGHVIDGQLTRLTVDTVLDDALINLLPETNDDLSVLELPHAQGRMIASTESGRYTINAKNFSFTDKNGGYFPPTDAQLTLDVNAFDKELRWSKMIAQTTHAHLSFDRLQLAPLTNLLLSIPKWKTHHVLLETLAPKGIAYNGNFDWEINNEIPNLRGEVALGEFSLRPYENYPGMTNISGKLQFAENDGAVHIDSRDAMLELPNVFPESIAFSQLNGTVRWRVNGTKNLEVNIDDLYFANDGVEGRLSGTWQADDRLGVADLKADIVRAEATHAYQYIPLIVDDGTRRWLRSSLLAGQGRHGRMVLRGPLIDFPFYDTDEKDASFLVEADIFDAAMRYDPEWPPIDHIRGKLTFRNESLIIQAEQGEILSAPIQEVTSIIPDLGADLPHLLVTGSVQTELGTYLRFLEESPVGTWTNHILRNAQGNGDALLHLHLDIPLSMADSATSRVNGELVFDQGRMILPPLPELEKIGGKLTFTENEIHADALSFSMLGNPGGVSLRNTEKGVLINGSGTLDLAQLKIHHPFPYTEYFDGKTPWTLKLETNIGTDNIDWTLETPLTGIRIDLPAPLAKAAETTTLLRISRHSSEKRPHEEIWQLQYQFANQPETVQLIAQRVNRQEAWQLKTLAANVGRQKTTPTLPSSEGIYANIALPKLDLDLWYEFLEKNPGTLSSDTPIRRIDLAADTLITLDKTLHDLRLKAEPGRSKNPLCTDSIHDCWTLDIRSAEVTGLVQWESSATSATENGRIHAMLDKLVLPDNDHERNVDPARATTTIEHSIKRNVANPWPVVDVDVAHLYYRDNDIGRATLAARPFETDWHIERFLLSNDTGEINADGWWRTDTSTQKTDLRIDANVHDIQKFLALFGVPEGLAASSGAIEGRLSWLDAPTDFDLDTLNGRFTVNIERGRFTKIEPGIGRLLGVLSLQALPRRIALDFRDVFSEGFAFDSITGTTIVNNGIMHTDDTLLDGPAAKVNIAGRVDLINETQKLDVRVRPSMTEGVSLGAAGAATLLMSTPVSAAAVGIGALVGQMIFDDPIGKMFSYEYLIEGSWSDPIVERKNVADNRHVNPAP